MSQPRAHATPADRADRPDHRYSRATSRYSALPQHLAQGGYSPAARLASRCCTCTAPAAHTSHAYLSHASASALQPAPASLCTHAAQAEIREECLTGHIPGDMCPSGKEHTKRASSERRSPLIGALPNVKSTLQRPNERTRLCASAHQGAACTRQISSAQRNARTESCRDEQVMPDRGEGRGSVTSQRRAQ